MGQNTGLLQRFGGPYSLKPLGYQQITSLAGVVGLTLPANNASMALINVSGAAIRYRDDHSVGKRKCALLRRKGQPIITLLGQ